MTTTLPISGESFKKEWCIYCYAGLSDKSKKVQAYTLLNLAGPEAVDKAETFVYADGEDHDDPEVLLIVFTHKKTSSWIDTRLIPLFKNLANLYKPMSQC